jgi:serine/threonine protein kinase
MNEHNSDKLDPKQDLTAFQNKLQKTKIREDKETIATVQETGNHNDSTTKLSHDLDIPQQHSFPYPDVLKIGDIIKSRFILVQELGRGGMGVVYKAKDLRKEEARDRNPYIALKVLSDNFKDNPDSFIALQRETRKTQDLAHPNIVTVYDFDKDGELVYMTMEWLEGNPLSVLLQEQYFRTISVKERWSIILQICSALAYAHKKNIIHLDLKPGNIYVKKDGTVKVLDFGIARAAKNTENLETSRDMTVFDAGILGALTPPYASCEMLENQEPDFRDDIFALACVAYEILTNHHPFNNMPATQARGNNLTASPISEISKKQNKALLHGLAFNRKDRVPTIDKFLQEAQLINYDDTKISMPWKLFILLVSWSVLVSILWREDLYRFYVNDNTGLVEEIIPQASLPIALTEEEIQKVSRMLEIAEMHAMIGRLVEPKGTNALDAYNEVLSIDPQNQQALTGIAEIASYYEQRARELWQNKDKKTSIEMLNKGLQASAKHQGLNKLKKMIDANGY